MNSKVWVQLTNHSWLRHLHDKIILPTASLKFTDCQWLTFNCHVSVSSPFSRSIENYWSFLFFLFFVT